MTNSVGNKIAPSHVVTKRTAIEIAERFLALPDYKSNPAEASEITAEG